MSTETNDHKITGLQANKFCKPLLQKKLKDGDKWYAITKKWFDKFSYFAYLNENFNDNNDTNDDNDKLMEFAKENNREYPPKMNNSELKHKDNTYQLKKELNENEHFIWICDELYQYFLNYFGINDGSLTFERKVINIGNEIRDELIIEMYPIYLCYILCDDDGKPDYDTKRIISVSAHSNIKDLIDIMSIDDNNDDNDDNDNDLSLDDDDNKKLRIWKKKKPKEFDDVALNNDEQQNDERIDEDWENNIPWPDGNGGEEEQEQEQEELPTYEQVKDEDQDEDKDKDKDEWKLLLDKDCLIKFGEWALNIDLHSNINYMFEYRLKNGDWKREYDPEEWRNDLLIGTKIDIYDVAYSKWYPGQVIEIDLNNKKIKVHYDGYSANYDEYLEIKSYRIAPLNTHTAPDPFWSTFSSIGNYGNYNNYNTTTTTTSWYGNDDLNPPSTNGCIGLRNLGNTCFMNSTIQCLSHCPLLVSYFLNKDLVSKEINKDNPLGWKGKVAETWSNLLNRYWSSKYSVLSPIKLKSTIAEIQPRFSGYQQHDSSELLQFLLDGLHEDLNRILDKPYTEKIESNNIEDQDEIAKKSWDIHKKRNDSIIVDLIQGQLKSRVECPDCKRISVTFDPFMFLSVPLPTEKKYVIKIVTIIYLDLNILPKKFAVKLPSLSSISDLNDQLESITKIPKNRLIITECWNNKIYKIFKNYESVDQISDNDKTICYEIPTDKEIKQLLFNDNDEINQFQLIPIYHQIIKQQQSYYYNNNLISTECFGIPLLMKLPLNYNINTNLIIKYITTLIKPYCQNFEKWDSTKQREIDSQKQQQQTDNNYNNNHDSFDSNAKSLSDSDNDNEAPTKSMGFDDDDDEDQHSSQEQQQQQQQIQQEQIEEKQEKETKEDDNDNDLYLIPYSIVILDKFGRDCSEFNGCNLKDLKDSILRIKDSSYDIPSIGIRWKYGAQNCFNHNSFSSPLIDESVVKHSSSSSSSSSSDYSSYKPQKRINLNECIDEFVAEETLSKNDAWYCRHCKEHKCAKKKLDLYTLPSICIIHLKRFTQNGYYREKNDAPVDYPINGLDLSQYITHNKNNDDGIYDLFAVSIHSGGLGGGHYIAYAKNLDDNKWYDFDDSCVSSINQDDAQTNSAYVLFYHKRNIERKKPVILTDDNVDDANHD